MSHFTKTTIGRPEQWLIDAAAEIGLDFAGHTHETTNEFIIHCKKRHGDNNGEKARGQLPITLADIDLIPSIVKAPDCAIIGIKRNHETFIAYSKRCGDGTAIYYEEILNSKRNKVLRSKTMFIKIQRTSLLLTRNW